MQSQNLAFQHSLKDFTLKWKYCLCCFVTCGLPPDPPANLPLQCKSHNFPDSYQNSLQLLEERHTIQCRLSSCKFSCFSQPSRSLSKHRLRSSALQSSDSAQIDFKLFAYNTVSCSSGLTVANFLVCPSN